MCTQGDESLDRDLVAELTERFGSLRLTPLAHEEQRNQTWLLRTAELTAVVKQYRWLSPPQVAELSAAENAVRAGGIPVPELLCQLPETSVVVHRLSPGRHVVPTIRKQLGSAASWFAAQLGLLAPLVPSWTPPRPVRLPYRAQRAIGAIDDADLASSIADDWSWLSTAASEAPATASHTDWRVDNLLFQHHHISAVLDWEDLVLLPAAEAIGVAAVSVTHTWRRDLYQPLRLESVTTFLAEIERQDEWLTTSAQRAHSHLACRYAAAVRLAEDHARGFGGVSLAALREVFP